MLTLLRQNLVPLLHSFFSILLFSALSWFFLFENPDPDYNDVLSVLIGALVTIVTIMFSAVLVALQLASAQFSPRVTRAFFIQNKLVQLAFYLFLAGIAYCLAIKFTFSTGSGAFRYPGLPVSGAIFGFFLISFVLPRFVFYIADSINSATLTREIALRSMAEIEQLYGKTLWQNGDQEWANKSKPACTLYEVGSSKYGFLEHIRYDALARIAGQHPNHAFFVEVMMGNFITPGEILVHVQTPDNQLPDPILLQQLETAFVLHKYRSYEQDVLYGVRQLVDVGIKAISPAVNDPTTCINCLHYLGVIVRRYAIARKPSLPLRAAPSNIQYREFNSRILLNAAFDQIYQWGKHDHIIVAQILNTLAETLHGVEDPAYKSAVQEQIADFELDKLQFSLKEQHEKVAKALNRLMINF